MCRGGFFIVNVIEQIQGFVDAPGFDNRLGQGGMSFTFKQRANQFRGLNGAKLERTGNPQHVIPLLLNMRGIRTAAGSSMNTP